MEKEKDGEGHSKQCKHCIRDSKDEFAFEQVSESRLQIESPQELGIPITLVPAPILSVQHQDR